MLYPFNLPALSDELTANLLAQANTIISDQSNFDKWEVKRPYPFTDEEITSHNLVERLGSLIPDTTGLEEAFASLLPFSATFEFYFMKNHNPDTLAAMAPFKDFKRSVAINYVLQTGGTAVETDFYLNDATGNEKKIYDLSLEKTSSYATQAGTWYAFDGTMVTSLAGIEDTCILINIIPQDDTLTFDNLMKAHPELFGTALTPQ